METGLELMHDMAVSLLRLALLAEICKEMRNVLGHNCVQLCLSLEVPTKANFWTVESYEYLHCKIKFRVPRKMALPQPKHKVLTMFNLDCQLQSLLKSHSLDAQHAKGVCIGPKPDTQESRSRSGHLPKASVSLIPSFLTHIRSVMVHFHFQIDGI